MDPGNGGISARRRSASCLNVGARFPEGLFRLVCKSPRRTLALTSAEFFIRHVWPAGRPRGARPRGKRQNQGGQASDRTDPPSFRGNLRSDSFACQLIGRDYAGFMAASSSLLLSLCGATLPPLSLFLGPYELKIMAMKGPRTPLSDSGGPAPS